MLYSGIAWNCAGFDVHVVDDTGRTVRPTRTFAADSTAELITYIRGLGEGAVAVVESTNGIIDGRLMAAGIEVRRADPAVLPPRPAFGSVSAPDVAQAGRREAGALTVLERHRGTQTGLEQDLAAGYAASAAQVDALTARGKWFGHGARDRREIALTFDDGPQRTYTEQVLDILERYGVPATFFCVGLYAKAVPEYLARMREQGHAIGNHTWSHPFLPELTKPQFLAQVERTGEAIANACGVAPTLFRPPYGSRSPEVMGWLAEIDATTVVWDVAPDDWAMPGADTIARLVLDEAQPGSVVLLHDSGGDRGQTVAALPPIIEGLLARGFSFARVDDLMRAGRGTTMDSASA